MTREEFEDALDNLGDRWYSTHANGEDPGCLCYDETDPDCPYHGLTAQREELERAGQERLPL